EAPTKGAASGWSEWTNVAGPRSRALVWSPWTGSRSATDFAAARDAASRPDDQGWTVQPGGVPHNGRPFASRTTDARRSDATALALAPTGDRVRVEGKFLFRGLRKLYLRGVTYGTFAPDHAGFLCPPPAVVD